jgi:hypothetical protein
MATPNKCMLQTAFKQLKDRGNTEGIERLAALVNDHDISTRVAAATARAELEVILTHNTFTSHRNNVCTACLRAQAAVDKAAKGDDKAAKKARNLKGKQAKSDLDPQVVLAAAEAGADVHQVDPTYPDEPVLGLGSKARLHYDEDGNVTVKDVPLNAPLTIEDDLSPLIVHFGLNPDRYAVIKDTFSIWMQSANNDGHRDVTYLYAAKFRKIGHVDPEMSNKDALKRWRSVMLKSPANSKPKFKAAAGKPGTYTLWPSDLQLGKTGTAKAVQNFQTGITQGLAEAQRLLDAGEAIEGIHIGWGGDETEGVANNYGNQSYIIELDQSDQLELDYDLRMWAVKEALQLGIPLSLSSVVSNHGEWTRNGGKDVLTTKNDNASTFIAKMIRKTTNELAATSGFPEIQHTIGAETDIFPGIVLDLSGTKVYSSHGHIEKGRGGSTELRTKNAVEKQILGDVHSNRRLGDVRLYVMAHYHHHYLIEDRGYTILGLPALEDDEGNDYMFNQHGVHSASGLVCAVVGDFDLRPYRNLNVFGQAHEKKPFVSTRDALGINVPR